MPRPSRRQRSQQALDDLVKSALTPPGRAMSPGAPGQGSVTLPGDLLARDPRAFGSPLGPASPFGIYPLDPSAAGGARPDPRRYQYDVAENLHLSGRYSKWNTLSAAATQIDLIMKAIEIRTGDLTKMDWTVTVSDSAVNTIMAMNNCSSAEASKIAREQNMDEIVRISEFWDNPYPRADRTWDEWITEFMWNMLVYDAVPVHPKYNLGGKLLGLDIIDGSTIKPLLDDWGYQPVPPNPAFQQILWGFPRGEFTATPWKDGVAAEMYAADNPWGLNERDNLSYFVKNVRPNSPYGMSAVEMSLNMANLYVERQKWLISEYVFGTSSSVYLKATTDEVTLDNLASLARIYNERLRGSDRARNEVEFVPPGFDGPTFRPQIDEKYKADYDEYIKKGLAVFFSIAPSQFGVVARAGMGGGKGASEGEADMSETVSSKPQNRYMERCINTLNRRYLGASRAIEFRLSDDEGSEDNVEQSKADQTWVFSGIQTPNEVRQAKGLPLSTLPEADTLWFVTGAAATPMEGLIAASQAPKALPPGDPNANQSPDNRGGVIPTGDKVSPNGDQEQSQGNGKPGEPTEHQEGTNGQQSTKGWKGETPLTPEQTAELKKFATHIRGRIGKAWRDFEFSTLPEVGGSVLNAEGQKVASGETARPKDLPAWTIEKGGQVVAPFLVKGSGPDKAIDARARQIAPKLSEKLQPQGLKDLLTSAVDHVRTTPMDQDSANAIANTYVSQLTFDTEGLHGVVSDVYNQGNDLANLAFAAVSADEPIASIAVGDLLSNAGILIQGVTQTMQDRITTQVTDGLLAGKSSLDIQDDIRASLGTEAYQGQAYTIASTEMTRAYNAGLLDQLTSAGWTSINWKAEDGACPICIDYEDGSPYPIDGAPMPVDDTHPNCRCWIEPDTDNAGS